MRNAASAFWFLCRPCCAKGSLRPAASLCSPWEYHRCWPIRVAKSRISSIVYTAQTIMHWLRKPKKLCATSSIVCPAYKMLDCGWTQRKLNGWALGMIALFTLDVQLNWMMVMWKWLTNLSILVEPCGLYKERKAKQQHASVIRRLHVLKFLHEKSHFGWHASAHVSSSCNVVTTPWQCGMGTQTTTAKLSRGSGACPRENFAKLHLKMRIFVHAGNKF